MSLQDGLFSEDVERDVRVFVESEKRKRVLVFPPVNNYRRFLIHDFVQNEYQHLLYTFSIGQGPQRRTVVCYKTDVIRDPKSNGASTGRTCGVDKVSDSACAMGVEDHRSSLVSPENSRQRQVKSVPSVGIYRPPPARKATCDNQFDAQQDQPSPDSSQSSKANRQKRPDRAVYVPRHRRSNDPEGSPLSRDTPKAPKLKKNRHSTTSSPSHTWSSSSADNGSATSESSHVLQGTENEVDESNTKIVIGVNLSEKSFASAHETSSRQCYSHEDIPIDDTLTSGNGGSLAKGINTITDDKVDDFEPETFPSDELTIKIEERGENSPEHISQSSDPPAESNGIDDETSDACLAVEPDTVQRDVKLQHSDTELILLHSCKAGAEESEMNHELGSLPVVEKEESSRAATDESIRRSLECENISSEGQTNGHIIDLIMSEDSNRRKEKIKEELPNRDEVVNHKNRRIIRQNLVSDVLLISDAEPRQESAVTEKPLIPISSPLSPTKEKKVKKVERPKSKPAPPPLPPSKVNRDECDWDSLFDDNGDCLDPTLIEELTTAVGDVTIEQPKSDYRSYTTKAPVEVSNDEFAHVVEIYNFPSDFKTSDLAAVFSPFKNGGFELKWVDDTHCLGVFSSPLIAAEVLASDHSFVKTRPLSEATALSKTKARRSAEFLQPYRARPATCAALARRLVTGALGVRLATARQEREREKIVLREAKERRRLANKQREDAWEGVVAEK